MPTPQVVDRFNVDGQEYSIEPVLDPIPASGSPRAVTSGGVFADKSDVPVKNSTKNFTAAGAYDFFASKTNLKDWLAQVYAPFMFKCFKQIPFPEGIADRLRDVAVRCAGGKWYAYNSISTGAVYYSENLHDWAAVTGTGINSQRFGGIVYGNNKWVLWDTLVYKFRTSSDGINFDNIVTPSVGLYAPRMLYVNDRWFIVDYNGSSYKIYTTQDFVTLIDCLPSVQISGTGVEVFAPMYFNGVYILAASNGVLYRSTNGVDFSVVSFAAEAISAAVLVDVVGEGNVTSALDKVFLIVARVSGNNTWLIRASVDGTDFYTLRATALPAASRGYYAVAFNGTILFGEKYDPDTTVTNSYGGIYVGSVGADSFESTHFITWAQVTQYGCTFGAIMNMCCINGVWVVHHYTDAAQSSTILRDGCHVSLDGSNWSGVGGEFFMSNYRTYYANGTYVKGGKYSSADQVIENMLRLETQQQWDMQ